MFTSDQSGFAFGSILPAMDEGFVDDCVSSIVVFKLISSKLSLSTSVALPIVTSGFGSVEERERKIE